MHEVGENPVKIIKWEDGEMEAVYGSMEDVVKYAEIEKKEKNLQYVIV